MFGKAIDYLFPEDGDLIAFVLALAALLTFAAWSCGFY